MLPCKRLEVRCSVSVFVSSYTRFLLSLFDCDVAPVVVAPVLATTSVALAIYKTNNDQHSLGESFFDFLISNIFFGTFKFHVSIFVFELKNRKKYFIFDFWRKMNRLWRMKIKCTRKVVLWSSKISEGGRPLFFRQNRLFAKITHIFLFASD